MVQVLIVVQYKEYLSFFFEVAAVRQGLLRYFLQEFARQVTAGVLRQRWINILDLRADDVVKANQENVLDLLHRRLLEFVQSLLCLAQVLRIDKVGPLSRRIVLIDTQWRCLLADLVLLVQIAHLYD